jgi:hypothetical protein
MNRAYMRNLRLLEFCIGEQVVNPTQDEFNDLLLYETYAAAAYCPENYNNGAKNRQLSCKSGNCDSAKNATIVLSIPP